MCHLIGMLDTIGISPEHGITGTASRGDLEGPRSGGQTSGTCVFSRHEPPEAVSEPRRAFSLTAFGTPSQGVIAGIAVDLQDADEARQDVHRTAAMTPGRICEAARQPPFGISRAFAMRHQDAHGS